MAQRPPPKRRPWSWRSQAFRGLAYQCLALAVVVGGFSESDDEPFPIGSRWQLDTPGLLATIRHTGRAARVEDYAQAPGDGAGAVWAAGVRSAVGSPIVVEGGMWGAIVLLSAVNYIGVKPAAVTQNVFTLLKLGALAALIVTGLVAATPTVLYRPLPFSTGPAAFATAGLPGPARHKRCSTA